MKPMSWDEAVSGHPAEVALRRLFADLAAPPPAGWQPTGWTRADYLPLLAGNVDHFKAHQDAEGAIIDPYEKRERQYSTPAFALAAATLVAHANRGDLLEPALRAFSFALAALANKTTADGHPDFYIPMLVHAHRLLAGRALPEQRARWAGQFRDLVPEETYRDTTGRGNWNIVHLAGEAMRRRDGLVAPERAEAQRAYLESRLERQEAFTTALGMYADPNVPLAYDAFPRLWLEDMLADGAYDGPRRERLETFLTRGALSTLLLQSPAGEWASGGRSAQHQWNEAQLCVIGEVHARRWQAAGRPDVAGAFKRSARLALDSLCRWQRPSGELWIVKNRADPARRHGFEGYSFHSQYNLLAVAMLAIAYARADDAISERPAPADTGGYVFDARDPFHKIAANAGGTYVLIDTGADTTYDATGLLRVHRADVALSPYSSNAAPRRTYGPNDDPTKIALTPGLAWKLNANDAAWRSLADARHRRFTSAGPPFVTGEDLVVREESPARVAFTVRYELGGEGMPPFVEEDYTIAGNGAVEVCARLGGDAPARARLTFPALVSDGQTDARIALDGERATIRHADAILIWEVLAPEGAALALEGPPIPTRNGFVRALAADLPPGTREARWRVRLEPAG